MKLANLPVVRQLGQNDRWERRGQRQRQQEVPHWLQDMEEVRPRRKHLNESKTHHIMVDNKIWTHCNQVEGIKEEEIIPQ